MSLVRLLARHREAGLTELECSTLARKLGGLTTAEIAAEDGVSARAVRERTARAAKKLGAYNARLVLEESPDGTESTDA